MEFLSQMLIGDVARLSNTTPATIRYYEELGLLTKPARSQAGYRHYGDKAIEEIQFIRKGQGLGFSLEEIANILKIGRSGESPCTRVLDLAERNLLATEERLRRLHALRDRLAAQIQRWRNQAAPSACNSSGLCEIINSAELPSKGSDPFSGLTP